MHYYQFNIDGYRAATAHLTNDEDLAYRRLLDMYYDTEDKIPLETEWVARRLRLACEVVNAVLVDMFVKHEDGWFHPVCDENIKHYQAMAEKNRANGRLGGRRKKPSGLPVETDSEPNAKATNNYEPITKNHKPITKNQSKEATVVATYPEGLDIESWERWLSYRKSIGKALKPASIEAAQESMIKFGKDQAAVVENSIANGYQGLFALKETHTQARMSKQQALEARNDEVARQWLASKRAQQ